MESIKRRCTILFRQVHHPEANERKPTKRKSMEGSLRLSTESRLVSNKQLNRLMWLRLQIQSMGFIWYNFSLF